MDQKLRQVFKLPHFRTHQKEAIDCTMAGKDGEHFAVAPPRAKTLSICTHADGRRQKLDL